MIVNLVFREDKNKKSKYCMIVSKRKKKKKEKIIWMVE